MHGHEGISCREVFVGRLRAFWLVFPVALILHQVENLDRFLQGALPAVAMVLSLIDGGATLVITWMLCRLWAQTPD